MAPKRKKKVAKVACSGGCHAVSKIENPVLDGDCSDIMQTYPEGVLECQWGCLGCGSCVNSCKFDAIHINSLGYAEVDFEKCIGCGMCVKKCPKNLISLTYPEFSIVVACSNKDKGAVTRKQCSVGCIACSICVKNCPSDAIYIEENHAIINEDRCIACGMCALKCPRSVILDMQGIMTP